MKNFTVLTSYNYCVRIIKIMKTYTLENKPNFKYGDYVKIDMSGFLGKEYKNSIENGIIVGKPITHIIDQWLVCFDHDFSPTYPYRVVSVPHTFILEE